MTLVRTASVIGLVLMLGLAGPAFAELTNIEKAEVKKYHEALQHLEDGWFYLGLALRETRADNRAVLADAWRAMLGAHRHLHYAAALLIHANAEMADLGDALRQKPVAEWVQLAWARTDAATEALRAAQAALDRARGAAARSAEYYDAVRRARDIWVAQALSVLRTVDRKLGYGSPLPRSHPRIIGPHGSYDSAVHVAYTSMRFLDDALEHALEIYAAPEPLYPDYVPFWRIILRGIAVARHVRAGLLNFALIPLSATECELNPFQLVARALGPMTSHTSASGGVDGAPYHFNQVFGEISALHGELASRPVARGHLSRFLQRWVDAWRFSDGAVWKSLEFPDETLLAQLRQQRTPASDPIGPPLCP